MIVLLVYCLFVSAHMLSEIRYGELVLGVTSVDVLDWF